MNEPLLPATSDGLDAIATCLERCVDLLDRAGLVIAAAHADHARALLESERARLRR